MGGERVRQKGGFLKWWYPTTIGPLVFPTKNHQCVVFLGYIPPFHETPKRGSPFVFWNTHEKSVSNMSLLMMPSPSNQNGQKSKLNNDTIPPILMVQWKRACMSKSSYLSNIEMFHWTVIVGERVTRHVLLREEGLTSRGVAFGKGGGGN